MFPQFCFPQTHHFLEFITWCESRYIPSQRAIVVRNNEIMFSITSKSICQDLQIHPQGSLLPFSTDSLMEIYQNLTFQQQSHIFGSFLLEYSEFAQN